MDRKQLLLKELAAHQVASVQEFLQEMHNQYVAEGDLEAAGDCPIPTSAAAIRQMVRDGNTYLMEDLMEEVEKILEDPSFDE